MVTTFHELPRELTEKILQLLSLTERFRLARVCRAWKQFHLAGLDAVDGRKEIDAEYLQAVVKSLESLTLQSRFTLSSLTVHLHCGCVRDDEDGCRCESPIVTLLPRKLDR